jgi:hypothetical protein
VLAALAAEWAAAEPAPVLAVVGRVHVVVRELLKGSKREEEKGGRGFDQ